MADLSANLESDINPVKKTCATPSRTKRKPFKFKLANKERSERRKTKYKKEFNTYLETNKKPIKNLPDKVLTNEQINLLGKDLKFIPNP